MLKIALRNQRSYYYSTCNINQRNRIYMYTYVYTQLHRSATPDFYELECHHFAFIATTTATKSRYEIILVLLACVFLANCVLVGIAFARFCWRVCFCKPLWARPQVLMEPTSPGLGLAFGMRMELAPSNKQ